MSKGVASRRHFLKMTGIAAGAERIVSVITNNGHFPGPRLRFKEGQPVADRGGYAGSVSVFVPRVDRARSFFRGWPGFSWPCSCTTRGRFP
jgi:hypothetical protein